MKIQNVIIKEADHFNILLINREAMDMNMKDQAVVVKPSKGVRTLGIFIAIITTIIVVVVVVTVVVVVQKHESGKIE